MGIIGLTIFGIINGGGGQVIQICWFPCKLQCIHGVDVALLGV